MARVAAILLCLVVVVGAVRWWKPFLTLDRVAVTATPSPGSIRANLPVPVARGSKVCVAPAPIDRSTALAQVALGPLPSAAQLTVETTGPGYRRERALQVRASNAPTVVEAPVVAPPRDVVGRICFRNDGRTQVVFLGTNEPLSIGQAQTSVDGKRLEGQAIGLNLLEARRQSMLDRAGTIVDHASAFTGGAMPVWLTWLVVLAFVVGAPVAAVATLWLTLRGGDAGRR
jgi:hypothetical protein